MNGYLRLNAHQFKNKLAHYLRQIESGHCRGVVVCRYGKPIGVFMPLKLKKQSSLVDDA